MERFGKVSKLFVADLRNIFSSYVGECQHGRIYVIVTSQELASGMRHSVTSFCMYYRGAGDGGHREHDSFQRPYIGQGYKGQGEFYLSLSLPSQSSHPRLSSASVFHLSYYVYSSVSIRCIYLRLPCNAEHYRVFIHLKRNSLAEFPIYNFQRTG